MGPMLRRLAVAAVGTAALTGALAAGATAASAAPATSTAPVTRDADGITVFIDIDLGGLLCPLFEDFCADDPDTGDDVTGPAATVGPEIPAGDGVNR